MPWECSLRDPPYDVFGRRLWITNFFKSLSFWIIDGLFIFNCPYRTPIMEILTCCEVETNGFESNFAESDYQVIWKWVISAFCHLGNFWYVKYMNISVNPLREYHAKWIIISLTAVIVWHYFFRAFQDRCRNLRN